VKTMKSLILTGFAALSLGTGIANAQNLTPSANEAAYWEGQSKVNSTVGNHDADRVQSGSSDMKRAPPANLQGSKHG
jgi:hypothetical protein